MKKTVLFVCVGNSGRSQMAEAFFRRLFPGWSAASAGIDPDKRIHPSTVQVMHRVGIDVSHRKPKPLTPARLEHADRIVVMDPRVLERIPREYRSKVESWKIDGLLNKPIDTVERIRDQIRLNVERLGGELGASGAGMGRNESKRGGHMRGPACLSPRKHL